LADDGIDARSVNASLLFEPWTVETKTGGFYRVYTPFWKSVRHRTVARPEPAPAGLSPPGMWPRSDHLDDWCMGESMNRGAAIVARHVRVGEAAARDRLGHFVSSVIDDYKTGRDLPAKSATSKLSENLAYGEISARQIWHAGLQALQERGHPDAAETFLKEIVWREFAYHLLFHSPQIETGNWRGKWDQFPWREDSTDAEAWRRGQTGIEMVDAAMREMYVTGTMHNRTRMLAASFLTKHLLTHWRVGEAWFRDCLVDWDVASNAMGWQWVAGSGPDAAPYFRIFNPDTQADKFDRRGVYRDRWIAEGRASPHPDGLSFFDAIPRSWRRDPTSPYPSPVISLALGRERALEAYSTRVAAE
ncbi:MAG: deoxyribodipyrimidine photo-lyase, partial [Pseudomonadota bacterium]